MDLDSREAFLLLGSNLGESRKLIDFAIELIAVRAGDVLARSSYYQTAAWGKTDQPDFINVAVKILTKLSPIELLDVVLHIELELGRVRKEKWGARLIDIDLILFGQEVVEHPKLRIPHPEMQHRKFVLEPLKEIAAEAIHPLLKKSIFELLSSLEDKLAVHKTD